MTIFTDIKESAAGRELSLRWYRERVRALGQLKPDKIIREGKKDSTARIRPTYGMLNLFFYFPEKPERLSYYDMFPLTLPVVKHNNGFTGLNFHYLSVPMRVKLLEIISGGFGDETSQQVNVTYSKIKRHSYVKPTIRRYKANHVGSLFLQIPLEDMLLAAILPVQAFYKGRLEAKTMVSPEEVWRDSRRIINYGTR